MSKMTEKIAALLAQAEGTDNEAERETFFEKAQSLAATYSIDLAVARAVTAKKEKREQPEQRSIFFGAALARRNTKKHLVTLIGKIFRSNDIEYDVYRNSSGVVAYGMPSDIEAAEALFASISVQMVRAADEFIRSGEYKKEETYRQVTKRDMYGSYKTWEYAPVDGRVARAEFYMAYARRIGARLWEARKTAEESAEAQEVALVNDDGSSTTTSTALVLADKRDEVRNFKQRTSKARGSYKGYSSGGGRSATAQDAGHAAGNRARLGTETAIGGQRKSLVA